MIFAEAMPELIEVMFFAERRSEDVFSAFEIGTGEFIDGEEKILRTGFGEGRHSPVASFANFVEGVFGGQVNDVDRRAGDFGHGDGAMNSFRFGLYGTSESVIDGCALTFGQGSLYDDINNSAVFGVHTDESAVFGGLAESFENGGVVNHENAGIRHEEFEAGDTFVNHGIHIFKAGFAEVSDDHVQAVIDRRFLIGLFPPSVESVAHLCAFGLNGEIDEGGGATEGSGFGTGFEIVGGGGAAEGHIEMSVNVDAAWEEEETGGVDHLVGIGGRDGYGDVFDGLVFDQQIRGIGALGGDDGAVLD